MSPGDEASDASPIVVDRSNPGLVVLGLSGEHDVSTAGELRSELRDAHLEQRSVVLELSFTEFVDSTVLGVIVGALRRAREAGQGFVLVVSDDPSGPVNRLLEMTGLGALFPLFTTRQPAIDAASVGVNAPAGWSGVAA